MLARQAYHNPLLLYPGFVETTQAEFLSCPCVAYLYCCYVGLPLVRLSRFLRTIPLIYMVSALKKMNRSWVTIVQRRGQSKGNGV
jgi:hypothetical protein